MVRVFVDTSAFIALLEPADVHHEDAVRALGWLRTRADLVTTNYVVVESAAVVRRRSGKEASERLFDSLFPVVDVAWVDRATHAAAIAAYRAEAGTASLVDQVSFAVMRAQGIELGFAFDRDFEQRGFGRVNPARQVHEAALPYGSTELPDMVSVSEIAQRTGRPANTIQSWRRRHRDFPEPVAQLAAGPIWSWPSVDDWIGRRPGRQAKRVNSADSA